MEPPGLVESNIFVPPSSRTLRVEEVIAEPSALPAEEETISRPLTPNTPLLPEVNVPLEVARRLHQPNERCRSPCRRLPRSHHD